MGGVTVSSNTNGILYKLDSMIPTKFRIHNYMHEMGTAIQTQMVIRVPWIGATPSTLAALASSDSLQGYTQTDESLSFVHMIGDKTLALDAGGFAPTCSVVPSSLFGAKDSGHYAPYNSSIHKPGDIVGKVLGLENMITLKGYADRVRTQFDRAESFSGPYMDSNPTSFLMGGSATRGMDYQLSLGTNGFFRKSIDQNKTPRDESATYALIHLRI